MKKFKLYALILVIVMLVASFAACGPKDPKPEPTPEQKVLEYVKDTELKVSIAHDSTKTSISFKDSSVIPTDGLKLADGVTYQTGDLKPVWSQVQKELNIKFNDVYAAGNVQKSYETWKNASFAGVDVLLGNATDIVVDGKTNKLLNLADYLEYMPNFKKFLDANPLVQLSIVSDTDSGAIYYAPYFDGYDDIERYFLMRSDWVEILLDGAADFTASASDTLTATSATPYMPTTGKVKVTVVKKDNSGTEEITKDYDVAGNPVAKQNALASKTGINLVKELRTYIDKAYNGYYGQKRSDLFVGQNASWDADELTALLRCVTTNTQALTGQNTDKVVGMFPRETKLERVANMLGIASMYGARGMTSAQDYLYFNDKGELCDSRQENEFYDSINRLNALYKEGLILQDFDTYGTASIYTPMYTKNLGFMLYDYAQTQCAYNEYGNAAGKALAVAATGKDFNLTPVINPVAKWNDGTAGGTYMRFTENWRGVKTQGWCINADVAKDANKLGAAIALFDFPWSAEGSVLMTYGPGSFTEGTTSYKGKEIPKMSAENEKQFKDTTRGNGNFTNYARQFLGTTLGIGFVKDQGFEYQCTTEGGKAGTLIVSNAIAHGVLKHVTPEIQDNMFYTMVPTTLPTTAVQDDTLTGLTALIENFSKTSTKYGCYVDLIKNGYGGTVSKAAKAPLTVLPNNAAEFVALVSGTVKSGNMGGGTYLYFNREAWTNALAYYNASISE